MSLIKGLNKNISDLHINSHSLEALYRGTDLIWKKDESGFSGESNMISSDSFILVSEDGLILMGK